MRIGTWNLAGRWSDDHLGLMLDANCDVWLLTEISERMSLPGYAVHHPQASIARRRRSAAVASRLPWVGTRHAEKTAHTIDDLRLRPVRPLVWGGAECGGKRLSDHDAYVVDAQEA